MGTRSIVESSTAIEAEACREAAKRILASRTFSKTPRLCSLLEYVVENSLAGNLDNLTEQQIGIQVFRRSPGYNSGEDTIVRGTARHLRQRLEQYYLDEGLKEPLRISVPKGGYVAHFEDAGPINKTVAESVPLTPPPSPTLPPAETSRTGWPLAAKALVGLFSALAVLLPLGVYLWLRSSQPP